MGIDDDGLRSDSSPGNSDRRRAADTLVGLVVASRYRIERLISAGAYTVVVDAVDVQLDRLVTVKLVRPEISELPEFQRRFEQVLRSMSTLSHVNIADVHDWGEDRIGGRTTLFAVVEHLGAGSMRDLSDRGRLLSPSQALVVGLDACRALDHAHRRNLVHGELTPSKLVFGDDRRLRVIDFGLARLLGSSAWREPATVETHVARYASPEQALGQPIDAKSDVYALALTLIEAVTGSVPFAAESTVATLSARIGKLTPVSADLGALAAVLERAARPDRGDRWTAAELGRALVRAAEMLPRPEPLPLVTSGVFGTESTRRPTDPTGGVHRPAAPAPTVAPAPEAAVVPAPGAAGEAPASAGDANDTDDTDDTDDAGDAGDADDALDTADRRPPPIPVELVRVQPLALAPDAEPDVEVVARPVPTAPLPGPDPGDTPSGEPDDRAVPVTTDAPRRLWLRGLIGLVLLACLAAVGVAAYLVLRTPRHEVPELAGVTEDRALAAVEEFDWDVQTTLERSDEEPQEGNVIRTSPAPGEQLAEGEPLFVVISNGPELRQLPELRGMKMPEAREVLGRLRLEVSTTDPAYDEEIPPGSVASWAVRGDDAKRAGDDVLPGTEIRLTPSQGPAPRSVPDLRTLSVAQARSQLDELGLQLEIGERVFSRIIERDLIVRQRPKADAQLERGESVTVRVSKGPDLVVFPDLEGLGFRAAVRRLEESGFERGDVLGSTRGKFRRARVEGVTVEAGQKFLRGTSVDLVFL